MHGSGAVAGIGESTYYKRGESPYTEFQLACIAIRRAVEDAGLALADVDGFVSFTDQRNTPLRLARALGLKELRWTGIPWAGGGNSMAAAVQIADAAVSAGYARHVVVFRALAQGQFGRFGQAGGGGGGARDGRPAGVERNLRDPHARAPVRAAHRPVHARPRDLAGGALRDRARLLRQRAAQPARAALRTAADARGVPRVALGRDAVPPLRLLSRERRRRGGGRDDHRAGARPAPSSRPRSSPRRRGSARSSARSTSRRWGPRTTGRSARTCGSRPDAGRRTSTSPSSTRTSPDRC